MSLKRRGRIWHYEFEIDGERYRGTTRQTDKAKARIVEQRKRDDIALGPEERAVTLTDASVAWWNARGHGRWLRHTLGMPGWDYCALLLSWDWPAARSNGLGALLDANPFSYCYLMRWKLDFTGEGSPPQRNAWFVWRRDWDQVPMQMRFMDREAGKNIRQAELFA